MKASFFKINPKWQRLLNIYTIILSFFVIWMLFFDTNSIRLHKELQDELQQLEDEAEFYKKEIEKDKKELDLLQTPEGQERYAREHYFMKKENEEIYLVVKDSLP